MRSTLRQHQTNRLMRSSSTMRWGVCPKWRVYGLETLAGKKKRYADLSASTFQELMVRASEFDAVVQRLAQFEAFM
ncbi:hypothetical protein Syun_012069 [Stephania yunnanensis]|uniref:Uncharacterized protein n=1 Tax=Stephania yunnanensis TaxID=152371 RepID=A0AAP0JZI8_9MAGN